MDKGCFAMNSMFASIMSITDLDCLLAYGEYGLGKARIMTENYMQ